MTGRSGSIRQLPSWQTASSNEGGNSSGAHRRGPPNAMQHCVLDFGSMVAPVCAHKADTISASLLGRRAAPIAPCRDSAQRAAPGTPARDVRQSCVVRDDQTATVTSEAPAMCALTGCAQQHTLLFPSQGIVVQHFYA